MLTTEQKKFIEDTVPVLRKNGEDLTRYFYRRMLTNNPELKEVFNLSHQQTGNQAKALAAAVLAYAENIERLEVLGDTVNLIVAKHVSLNIQPEQYAIVGDNLLNSISEVLEVPMDSELIAAWAVAYQQLADILIASEKAKYKENAEQEGGWTGWREFTITRKVKESSVISSFYLTPKDGKALPKYKAGQYISIRVTVPEIGHKQPRQYTLSNTFNEQEYRISVKKEAHEANTVDVSVSNALHNHFKEGDVVELSHPNGDFFLQENDRPNVFISAGVGITPMIAMLTELKKQGSTEAISFIHACQNDKVLAMATTVRAIKAEMPQVKTYLACEASEDETLRVDQVGYLDLSKLDEELLPKNADFYLCGPIGFMQAQYNSLIDLGIEKAQIHMELFGTGGVGIE